MLPTLDYVKQKFNLYNSMIFEGKLKELPFQLARARTFLGQIAYKRRMNADGTYYYYDFIFRISVLIDRPENVIEDTILHEMIHYFILSNQMQDNSPHGRIFQTMMRDINHRFNRHISISHRRTEEDKRNDTQRRTHLVCSLQMTDGRTGIFIAAQSRLFQLWDTIHRINTINKHKWYLSHNPFFNRYPRALKPKLYSLPQETINEELADAKELIRLGNKITTKRK